MMVALPGKAWRPGMRFSLEPVAFSPGLVAAHTHNSKVVSCFTLHVYPPMLQAYKCRICGGLTLSKLCKIFVEQLLCCKLGEVVIPKGVPAGLGVGARRARWSANLTWLVHTLLGGAGGARGGGAGWSVVFRGKNIHQSKSLQQNWMGVNYRS